MTIDDQLRDFARRAGEHQQPITVTEIVQRVSLQGNGSPATRSQVIAQHTDPNQMPVAFPEEEATMIDLDNEREVSAATSRRWPKRAVVAGLAAAAALVAIALIAIRQDEPEGPTPATQPPTTVIVPPTTPPQPLFRASGTDLTPGTYFVDEVDGLPTRSILLTLGTGWTSDAGWSIGKDGQVMTFSHPERVFLDACHPGDGYHPGPIDTLDGMVTALSEQGGWVDVTSPSAISIDGYSGKAFQRATPADFSNCTTGGFYPDFPSWENGSGETLGWSYYPPGDTETVWVLDLDGTVVVLETRVNAGQPPEAHAELAAILESIRIASV